MPDITTIEDVRAGDYRVRVGQSDDGTAWEAVVMGEVEAEQPTMQAPPGMQAMLLGGQADASEGMNAETPAGPAVTAPHKWVAVGFAIEAFEWDGMDTDTVDVDDGYSASEIGEMGPAQLLLGDGPN